MTKYLLSALLVIGVIVLCKTDAYSLSLIFERCEFYFRGSSSDDSDATDLLKIIEAGGAVKVCTSDKGDKVYYEAKAVSKKNEVHYFYMRRVFKTPVSDGHRWEYSPPKDLLQLTIRNVYMQIAVNSDVRQDDAGFIPVHGMSTSLFNMLNKAWKGILASEKQFDEACCSLSISSILNYSSTRELKRALYDDHRKDAPKLLSAEFIEGGDSRAPYYTFSVGNNSRIWDIDFDFSGESIRIEGIRGISLRSE